MADTAAAFWSQLETMRPRGISVVGREGGEATAAAEGPRSEEEEEEERRERRRRKEMGRCIVTKEAPMFSETERKKTTEFWRSRRPYICPLKGGHCPNSFFCSWMHTIYRATAKD